MVEKSWRKRLDILKRENMDYPEIIDFAQKSYIKLEPVTKNITKISHK